VSVKQRFSVLEASAEWNLGCDGTRRSLLFLTILSIEALSIAMQVPAVSQEVQAVADDAQNSPIIRLTTRLVNVSVMVSDSKGQPVQGLSQTA
jgi:hypothetical protein